MLECCKEWQNGTSESNHIYYFFWRLQIAYLCIQLMTRLIKLYWRKLCNETDPATKRTNVEKDAVAKFWTSKGKFENIDNVAYYDGRKVKMIYLIYFSYIFLCIGCFAVNNIRLSLTKYNLAYYKNLIRIVIF